MVYLLGKRHEDSRRLSLEILVRVLVLDRKQRLDGNAWSLGSRRNFRSNTEASAF